jgi:hypothetical protein
MADAVGQVSEAFAGFPFLPELPNRGIGTDMIGRTLSLVDQLGFELTSTGWASTSHPSRDQRRAAARLRDDVDLAAEAEDGYTGPFHVSVAGPWTLSAVVRRGSGEALVADAGASSDLGQAWVESVVGWCGRVAGLLPGATLSLQVDEPALPAVMAGVVRTASGLHRYRPVQPPRVAAAYEGLTERCRAAGVAETIIHCCAPGLDLALMGEVGFTTVSVDAGVLDRRAKDGLAAHWDSGGSLWLGVVPTDRPEDPIPGVDELLGPTLRLLDDLSVDPAGGRVTLTPACGLAGFTQPAALAVGRSLNRLAQALDEQQG